MSRAKIILLKGKCRRCGEKDLYTTNRPIHGSIEVKRRLELICSECITDDEQNEILSDQARGILAMAGGGR